MTNETLDRTPRLSLVLNPHGHRVDFQMRRPVEIGKFMVFVDALGCLCVSMPYLSVTLVPPRPKLGLHALLNGFGAVAGLMIGAGMRVEITWPARFKPSREVFY